MLKYHIFLTNNILLFLEEIVMKRNVFLNCPLFLSVSMLAACSPANQDITEQSSTASSGLSTSQEASMNSNTNIMYSE